MSTIRELLGESTLRRSGLICVILSLTTSTGSLSQINGGANYKQATKYSSEFLRQFVYDSAVTPNWIGKTDNFWYTFKSATGTHYYRVDPKAAKKEPLFDRVKLGIKLAEMLQKPVDYAILPITTVTLNDDASKLKFVVEKFQYEYTIKTDALVKLGDAPAPGAAANPAAGAGGGNRQGGGRGNRNNQTNQTNQNTQQDNQVQRQDQQQQDQQQQQQVGGPGAAPAGGDYHLYSPDKKQFLFAKKFNLYLAEAGKEDAAAALTTDGVEDYSFGGTNDDKKARPNATWSKDSKSFHITRRDQRGIKELFLVNSLSLPRPTLEKYRYAMPGEDGVRKVELYVYEPTSKKLNRIKSKWTDEGYLDVKFGKTSNDLYFVREDRLLRHAELCDANVTTGEIATRITEGFENANLVTQPVHLIEETDEMIWWTEKSGWGHFYLYDHEGKLKNAITSGEFRASAIINVDPKKRILYFKANGREKGENVYYEHLYSVKLDGTGLTLLDPGNATHNSTLAPSHAFVIDNCSRTDMSPVSVLRDAKGEKLMDLEQSDISRLSEVGWKMPETFIVKAADGVTDLYGNMWKPFDFDPHKKYPIIVNVYPGPQTEGVTHTFNALGTNQQLAQLGFIVIQVGHRGGTPTRSKAYASYGYYNLRDYGLADKKSAIEQLAARNKFIDIDRVGIFGHSGGAFMSAAAMLVPPYNEFFKAAVASSGNHDNNIYNNTWSERYHGLKEVSTKADDKKDTATKSQVKTGPDTDAFFDDDDDDDQADQSTMTANQGTQKVTEKSTTTSTQEKKSTDTSGDTKYDIKVPTNAELAPNLKGHLMLVHGEIDNNVHPANTMRLVDALVKANKRFEMLILPGQRHGYGPYQPYFLQRMWDFFATHLLGDRQTGADLSDRK